MTTLAVYRVGMSLDTDRWRPPVAIAHRGSRTLWPENTDLSFQGAYDLGYRHFETDLHLSADDTLVCFHDPTLDRTTNATGRVNDLTVAELQTLDAGYRHGGADGYSYRDLGVRIPTLRWLLETFPDTSVVVDLKSDGLARHLARLVDDLEAHDRLIVGSFSDARLAEFRALTKGRVATSVGPVMARKWLLASTVGRVVKGEASALQLPVRTRGVRVVTPRLVDAAHRAGLQVHVWTVNHVDEMTRLLDMGVDGLITDRPDVLKDLMIGRGEWTA